MKRTVPGALLLMFCISTVQAQTEVPKDPLLYFYNPRLDALGQDLQKAAGEVSNGQVYETQLSNLDTLAKLATDRIYSSGRRAALSKIEAASSWGAIWLWVDSTQKSMKLTDAQQKDWAEQAAKMKAQLETVTAAGTQADSKMKDLKDVGDLLEDIGKAKQVAQAGAFLEKRKLADITPTDLRLAASLQSLIGSVGATISTLAANAAPATSRSVAEQMKVDLAKAEINHLTTLMGIEEKRLAGQRDVRDLLTMITGLLTCPDTGDCSLTFTTDDGGTLPAEKISRNETTEDALKRFRTDKVKLKSVVYLLENYAALAARAELPTRLAELRAAIEERRFAIRREAIMARTYEQILLLGAQRISAYYKGGIKPETLAQFANALSTAGLIPTIAIK